MKDGTERTLTALPYGGARAILFDAFGTLCEIREKRQPFSALARLALNRERDPSHIMKSPMSLQAAAAFLQATSADIAALEADLVSELASIRLFPEVSQVLTEIKACDIKIAIISNLAAPYAKPLLDLLPFKLDAYAWSFDVGALKPDPAIFSWACDRLGERPEDCLMIGDNFDADYQGALRFGIRAVHLNREGKPKLNKSAIHTLKELAPAVL